MADPGVQQLTAELAGLAAAMRQLIGTTGKTANAIEANAQRTADINNELVDFQTNLVKGRKLSKQQEKLANDALKLKRKEIQAQANLNRTMKEASDKLKKFGPGSPEAIAAQNRANKALDVLSTRQAATADAASKVEGSFAGLIKGTKLAQAALVWFGSTLNAQAKQLVAQQKANAGLIDGTGGLIAELWNQQNKALSLGMSGEDLAKVVSANRQAINALGGTAKALDTLNPEIDRLRILTGSNAEALELAARAAREFAEKGIVASRANMQQFTNDLVQLGKQTGMNTQQAGEYYNEIANDIESMDLLRKARGSEREAILANQRAIVQQSIAMGMSAAQAKEAAKMLNKMVAAKPLDRIRQAAKIRALGGAMGIQGADEAAQGVIAGSRATADQKKAISQFSMNATNTMDQAAQGGLGSEIFASTLLDKLNLDEQFGKGSNFSTTLGDSMKPVVEAINKLRDSSLTPEGKMFGAGVKTVGQFDQIISGNNVIGVALAGIAAGVLSIATMMGVSKGRSLLSGIGRAGTNAGAARAAGGAAGTMGRVAGAAGKLGAAGAIVGGAYSAYDEYQQNGKMGSAVGKGVGTAAGSAGGMWAGAAGGAALGALGGPLAPVTVPLGALIGGVAGGMGGAWAGGAAGKAIGGMADSSSPKAQEEAQEAVKSTAIGIDAQIKQMDQQNSILVQMKALTERQVELAEKTLIALTLSDLEKQDMGKKSNLRKNNKFASEYAYV